MSENAFSPATPWRVLRWAARIWSIGPLFFVLAQLASPQTNPSVEVPWFDWLLVGVMAASVLSLALAWWREWLGGWLSVVLLAAFLAAYWFFRGEFFPWQALVWLGNVFGPALLFILFGWQESKLA